MTVSTTSTDTRSGGALSELIVAAVTEARSPFTDTTVADALLRVPAAELSVFMHARFDPDGDHLYALHQFSGYLVPCPGGPDTVHRLDKVEVTTLEGSALIVVVGDDGSVGFQGSDAMVTTADVEADNGVIHIIDGVLLPPADA